MCCGAVYLFLSTLFTVIAILVAFLLINFCLRTYDDQMLSVAQHGEEVWSITGNLRPSDFSNDMTIDQITIISQDKPPSYNEDPPTYDQAISMARANNIPIPNVHNSSSEAAKPAH
ncbi:hypothetical protein WA026_019108 [Henosepilachna vigintioctopunctata]|uniref:Uncharacterized protein n=1 Tax=Henosepilachna vigintioctopunctata TaxID=420089 RepID=A0AAW1VIQ0_9CUCU